jgi:PelA/Pel-15E family pectate lyase
MHRAVRFFREHASAGGGYIYQLSSDLVFREGEGVVTPTIAWIQPPGTPTVGMAYLEAYRLTQDELLLDAAVETGMALVRGQLVSGGWDNLIEFDPERRRRYSYRVDGNSQNRATRTTFDDDKSQSALRFLMQLDQELDGKNAAVAEAVQYALEAFLKAQYPNGAWPQRYNEFPDPSAYRIKQASYPESWSRTFPGDSYSGFYTLNDGAIADVIDTMLDAYDHYGDDRFLQSGLRGGDFFLLAQMPEPQPGWCQQYDVNMHPMWARKFEPAAITGGESQGVMRTLLQLYERTGNKKYIEPIPRALKYYRRSLLSDGRLARFYELKTNTPLYFTREYVLTYDDGDLPTHYGFKVGSSLDSIEREYQRLANLSADELRARQQTRRLASPKRSSSLTRRASEVANQLDARGAWVEDGSMRYHENAPATRVITSRTFVRNLEILAEFIAAARQE